MAENEIKPPNMHDLPGSDYRGNSSNELMLSPEGSNLANYRLFKSFIRGPAILSLLASLALLGYSVYVALSGVESVALQALWCILGFAMFGEGVSMLIKYPSSLLFAGYGIQVCVMPFLWIIGAAFFTFNRNNLSYLAALAEDSQQWESVHGEASTTEVTEEQEAMFRWLGFGCFLLATFYMLTLIPSAYYAKQINWIHNLFQILLAALIGCSLALLVFALICHQLHVRKNVATVVDENVPNALTFFIIVLTTLCIVCFLAVWKLRRNIESYSLLAILLTSAAIGWYGYVTLRDAPGFNQSFNCIEVFTKYDRDFVEVLGCANKYTQTAASVDDLDCEKHLITENWEFHKSGNEFACFNEACCAALKDSVRAYFDLMGTTGVVTSSLGLIVVLFSCFSRVDWHQKDDTCGKVLLIIICISVFSVGLYVMAAVLPADDAITYLDDVTVTGAVSDGGFVQSQLLDPQPICSDFQLGYFNFTCTQQDGCVKTLELEIQTTNV